jgi:NIPSNAP
VERRTFLTSMLSAAIAGGAAKARGEQGVAKGAAPEFYLWRQYMLRNGTQPRRLAEYLEQALVPALNRLGHKPIGVFDVLAGVPAPTLFTLTPFATLDSIGTVEAGLQQDAQFAKTAAPYMDAVAADPVYVRMETSLLAAFPNVPRVEVPAATATKGPRMFELRTYESHNERGHRMKVKMFAEMGEVDIFRRVGLAPVFFASTLAGPRMPNLIYMLAHENMAAREKSWDAFRNDAEWKKLRSTPGYADAEIVSNITTVLLRPASYSQI